MVDEVCELVEGNVGIDLDNIPGDSELGACGNYFLE